jgi:hypothetical protein
MDACKQYIIDEGHPSMVIPSEIAAKRMMTCVYLTGGNDKLFMTSVISFGLSYCILILCIKLLFIHRITKYADMTKLSAIDHRSDETKSRGPLYLSVYARASKRSRTGGQ